MSEEPRLDWANAKVSAHQSLTVPFTDALPDGWGTQFKSLLNRRFPEPRGETWGRIDLVEWNQTVHVDDVPEDGVDRLKASLDTMVDHANRNLLRERDRLEEQRDQDGREQQERHERTQRMQDRFRRSTR